MTLLSGCLPRRNQLPYWLVTASVVAAVVAVLPIAAAIVAGDGHIARSAFASAAPGTYAVGARPGDTVDVVLAVPAAGGDVIEAGRVEHLPGFGSKGAVSPDGQTVAIVTADRGTPAHPVASLLAIDLATGTTRRLAEDVDDNQQVVWSAASDAVVFTRTRESSPGASVDVLRVSTGGGEELLARYERVLGAYPVAIRAGGAALAVVLDSRGSTLYAGTSELTRISDAITRDWRLSADGSHMAFIEATTAGGLHYRGRVVALDGSAGVSAQAADADGQQLGVAWEPAGTVTFGHEPGAAAAAGGGGFDVPIAFSPDGRFIAAQRWSGSSFAQPGTMTLTVAGDGATHALPGMTRFFGWSAR